MTRKNILLLVLGSIVLEIIGLLLVAPAAAEAASHCTQEQINAGICAAGPFGARGIIGVILLVGGGILQLIAWILALVRSAKMGSWVWFVVVLLISQLGTLLYALFGPADRPRLPAYPGYPPTGYPPPGYPPPAGYPPPGSPTATG